MKKKEIEKTLILQHDQSDCGVACLLSIIRYYKGDNTLEALRELSGTSKQGTTLLGLHQAANQLGFEAEGCEANINALIEHGQPVILHVLIDKMLQHYVVCYGFENNHFIIGDPTKGIFPCSKQELENIWISKKCLTLKLNEHFIKADIIKKSKHKWLLQIIREDYSLLGISVAIGIAITVLGMVMAVFSQKLIDTILPSHNIQRLTLGIVLVAILLIARTCFMAMRQFLLLRQSKYFNNRIINAFYSTLLNLPKSFFDTRKIGELIARLNDTERIQKVINQIAGNFIIDGLMTITSLIFLYTYSWQVGVIATISLPIYFLLIYKFNKKIISAQKEMMVAYAHNEGNYINSMQGVSVIKNFNRQELFSNINQLIYGSYQDKVVALGKINIRLMLIAGVSGVLFLTAILGYSSFQVYNGNLKLGELMALLGIAASLLPSVANLALIAIPVNEAKVAFDRMFEFVSIKQENAAGEKITEFQSFSTDAISFRFPGRKELLKGVSMYVNKNELISIVGESGSGKSTLGQIIQKFYTKESGNIVINGNHKFENVEFASWRNLLGVVPQDIHLFNGTVLDNICLNDTTKEVEKIIAFCKEMGFSDFIEQLPQSYLTIVGETGINLSGGQKQIIALARVLYHKPQLLLLDEATAAMDRITEKFVLNLLTKLKENITVIFISHRLHILKNISDRIYVLENGSIIASGKHEDLLLTSNLYSNYWSELSYV